MSRIDTDIRRHLTKGPTNLIKLHRSDLKVDFSLDEVVFTITFPKDYPLRKIDTYSVDYSIESDTLWLQSFKAWLDNTAPSIDKLFAKLKEIYDTCEEDFYADDESEYQYSDEEEVGYTYVEDFDTELLKLQSRLRRKMEEAESGISISDDKMAKSPMFAEGGGKVLLKEFIDMKKKYEPDGTLLLTAVDDNIFTWNVKVCKLPASFDKSTSKIAEKFGYNYIEFELYFHKELYPWYPPRFRYVRPRLTHGLMHRLSSLTLLQLEYWVPTRSVENIIEKMVAIINKHGTIDTESPMNDTIDYPQGAYHMVEMYLIELAAHNKDLSIDTSDLDSTEYMKVSYTSRPESTKKSVQHWSSGTGYGHTGASEWNVKQYQKMQEENEKETIRIVTSVKNALESIIDKKQDVMTVISGSYLKQFLLTNLKGTTLVDMNKRKNLYTCIGELLICLGREESISIFDTLFEPLKELREEAKETLEMLPEESEDLLLLNMYINLADIVEPMYGNYLEYKSKMLSSSDVAVKATTGSKETYEEVMKK